MRLKSAEFNRGIIFAFGSIILWGAIIAVNKMAISFFQLNPFFFSSLIFTYAGIALMLIGLGGTISKEVFRSFYSWAYGFVRVLDIILFNLALLIITATEAVFLNRISIIMTLILSRIILSRKLNRYEMPGYLLIFGCYIILVLRQDGGFSNWAVWSVTLAALGNAILALLIETHPVAKKSKGLRSRCAYTGTILFVASLCFILAFVGIFFIANLIIVDRNGFFGIFNIFLAGENSSIFDLELHLIAIVVGVGLMAPTMYATFYAINLINADNMLMMGTIIPFSSLFFEMILSKLGLLDISSLDMIDIFLGVLISAGAFYAIIIRIKRIGLYNL